MNTPPHLVHQRTNVFLCRRRSRTPPAFFTSLRDSHQDLVLCTKFHVLVPQEECQRCKEDNQRARRGVVRRAIQQGVDYSRRVQDCVFLTGERRPFTGRHGSCRDRVSRTKEHEVYCARQRAWRPVHLCYRCRDFRPENDSP